MKVKVIVPEAEEGVYWVGYASLHEIMDIPLRVPRIDIFFHLH